MNETKTLASYIVSNRWDDVPADVRHEAKRAIINVVGCAIGGSASSGSIRCMRR
jgi:2-methylcitrate dehydratase PrpD